MAAVANSPAPSRREGRLAVSALAFLASVTALWWALALWPTPGEPAAWLARARAVCFSVGPNGLPDAAGWLLLVGQPLGVAVLLVAAFHEALREGLRELAALRWGRALLWSASATLALGLGAAGVRVARVALAERAAIALGEEAPPETYPRLDRPAPALGLVDQRGARLEWSALRGRPAYVTFAFAHCETVCPALVDQVQRAAHTLRERELPDARVPRVLIVTHDPWRDTPARLPALAQQWRLAGDDAVLSGSVADVEAALDRWGVPRARNEQSGRVDHPALVYVVDGAGRIAFASRGGTRELVELARRL